MTGWLALGCQLAGRKRPNFNPRCSNCRSTPRAVARPVAETSDPTGGSDPVGAEKKGCERPGSFSVAVPLEVATVTRRRHGSARGGMIEPKTVCAFTVLFRTFTVQAADA